MAQTGFPSRSANARVYPVTVDAKSITLCTLNATKDSWIFRNIGNCPVYIKYGDDCNPVVYTQKINPNTIFADDYGGVITACVDNNNEGLLLVTVKI